MSLDLAFLYRNILAVCPITCLTTGNDMDKTTWVIAYDPSATPAQQQAAQAVIDSFDLTVPSPAQVMAALMASGIQVISANNPALNGAYSIDPSSILKISGIAAGIAARQRLPGGGQTFNYGDIAGTLHAFTAEEFLNFAAAMEDVEYLLLNNTIPVQPVPIDPPSTTVTTTVTAATKVTAL